MPGLFLSERTTAMCPLCLETCPFWVQPVIWLWLVKNYGTSTHLQLTLSIVAFPTYPVVQFNHPGFSSRFRPAFTRRTPREGAVSRSPGRQEFLQYRPPFAVSLTCMDMQLRKSNDFRRPSPIFADGFGRTGRTQSVLRNPPLTIPCRGEKTGPSLRKRRKQCKKWPFSA
jgi:hypothetical protein